MSNWFATTGILNIARRDKAEHWIFGEMPVLLVTRYHMPIERHFLKFQFA